MRSNRDTLDTLYGNVGDCLKINPGDKGCGLRRSTAILCIVFLQKKMQCQQCNSALIWSVCEQW